MASTSPPVSTVSVTDAARDAIEHARRNLFPVRVEKWLVLGFLAFLDQCGRTGTVLVSSITPAAAIEGNNYLARTYTGLIPLIGHPHLTPQFESLQAAVVDWENSGVLNAALERVDVLIVNRITAGAAPWIKPADWRLIHRNADVAVLERRREAAP